MATKPEGKFQKELVQKLKSVGCVVLNVHGGYFQQSGWPDLYVASPHFQGWIELKVGAGKLSAIQAKRIKDLNERKVNAFCLNKTSDGYRINGQRVPFVDECMVRQDYISMLKYFNSVLLLTD